MFSLEEEEDYGGLFITQESSQSVQKEGNNSEKMVCDDDGFLGLDPADFKSPCASIVANEFHYSDISEDEVFIENAQQNKDKM